MKRLLILVMCLFATLAFADWDRGDPYKMHWPQLPDPEGWDVMATQPKVLADDWECSETGPVGDVHIWGSWRSDDIGEITSVHLSIHENLLPDTQTPFSRPGELLWQRDFGPDLFTVRDYGNGSQGWYNPNIDSTWVDDEHKLFHQINIMNIKDPFRQQEKIIYWLDVSVRVDTSIEETFWGWKSSRDSFEDDAVWADMVAGAAPVWRPLTYPDGTSIDLAFVIVPEPMSLVLLGFGSLVLLKKRR